jgi:hypothetical protein
MQVEATAVDNSTNQIKSFSLVNYVTNLIGDEQYGDK